MRIPNPIPCNDSGPIGNRTQTWGLQSPRADHYHYGPKLKDFLTQTRQIQLKEITVFALQDSWIPIRELFQICAGRSFLRPGYRLKSSQYRNHCLKIVRWLLFESLTNTIEPMEGFEPPTRSLQVSSSTTELHWHWQGSFFWVEQNIT